MRAEKPSLFFFISDWLRMQWSVIFGQSLISSSNPNLTSAINSNFNTFAPCSFNPLTAELALRALIDFTLSNARRFYSSMGNPLNGKGLSNHDDYGNNVINFAYLIMKNSSFARFARAFLIFGHLRPRLHLSGYF